MTSASKTDYISHLSSSFSKDDFDVFYINGEKIKDKRSFLEEFSEKLKFPAYFGFNWDAFSDCLTDMSWLDGKGIVIIYKASQHFIENNPDEWRIASQILLDAIGFWRKQNIPMIVMFV